MRACIRDAQVSVIFIVEQGLVNELFTFIASYAFQSKYALSILVLKGLGQKLLSLLNFMSALQGQKLRLFGFIFTTHLGVRHLVSADT